MTHVQLSFKTETQGKDGRYASISTIMRKKMVTNLKKAARTAKLHFPDVKEGIEVWNAPIVGRNHPTCSLTIVGHADIMGHEEVIGVIGDIVDEMGQLGDVLPYPGGLGVLPWECPCGCALPYIDCLELGLTAHSYNPAIRQCRMTMGATGCGKKGCMEGHCYTYFDPNTRGLRMRDENPTPQDSKTHEDGNDSDSASDPTPGEEDISMAKARMLVYPDYASQSYTKEEMKKMIGTMATSTDWIPIQEETPQITGPDLLTTPQKRGLLGVDLDDTEVQVMNARLMDLAGGENGQTHQTQRLLLRAIANHKMTTGEYTATTKDKTVYDQDIFRTRKDLINLTRADEEEAAYIAAATKAHNTTEDPLDLGAKEEVAYSFLTMATLAGAAGIQINLVRIQDGTYRKMMSFGFKEDDGATAHLVVAEQQTTYLVLPMLINGEWIVSSADPAITSIKEANKLRNMVTPHDDTLTYNPPKRKSPTIHPTPLRKEKTPGSGRPGKRARRPWPMADTDKHDDKHMRTRTTHNISTHRLEYITYNMNTPSYIHDAHLWTLSPHDDKYSTCISTYDNWKKTRDQIGGPPIFPPPEQLIQYEWGIPIKNWNKLMKALHGNTPIGTSGPRRGPDRTARQGHKPYNLIEDEELGHAYRTKTKPRWVLPEASRTQAGHYTWRYIKVAPDPNIGQHGVIATRNIPPGTMFPIIGKWLPEEEIQTLTEGDPIKSHLWIYRHGLRGGVDGRPSLDKNAGCKGLAIAMMVNEPDKGKDANCILARDCLITVKHINKGVFLSAHYGEGYKNIRARQKYTTTTLAEGDEYIAWNTMNDRRTMPNKTERNKIIRELLTRANPNTSLRDFELHFLRMGLKEKTYVTREEIRRVNLSNSLLRIGPSGIKGMRKDMNNGVFAKVDLPEGQHIGHYTGEHLTMKLFKVRYPDDDARYVMSVGEEKHAIMIDAVDPRRASITRWINCPGQRDEANCLAEEDQNGDIEIKALTRITAGEELMIDYGARYPWGRNEMRSAAMDRKEEKAKAGKSTDTKSLMRQIKDRMRERYRRDIKRGTPHADMVWASQNGKRHLYLRQTLGGSTYRETEGWIMTEKRWTVTMTDEDRTTIVDPGLIQNNHQQDEALAPDEGRIGGACPTHIYYPADSPKIGEEVWLFCNMADWMYNTVTKWKKEEILPLKQRLAQYTTEGDGTIPNTERWIRRSRRNMTRRRHETKEHSPMDPPPTPNPCETSSAFLDRMEHILTRTTMEGKRSDQHKGTKIIQWGNRHCMTCKTPLILTMSCNTHSYCSKCYTGKYSHVPYGQTLPCRECKDEHLKLKDDGQRDKKTLRDDWRKRYKSFLMKDWKNLTETEIKENNMNTAGKGEKKPHIQENFINMDLEEHLEEEKTIEMEHSDQHGTNWTTEEGQRQIEQQEQALERVTPPIVRTARAWTNTNYNIPDKVITKAATKMICAKELATMIEHQVLTYKPHWRTVDRKEDAAAPTDWKIIQRKKMEKMWNLDNNMTLHYSKQDNAMRITGKRADSLFITYLTWNFVWNIVKEGKDENREWIWIPRTPFPLDEIANREEILGKKSAQALTLETRLMILQALAAKDKAGTYKTLQLRLATPRIRIEKRNGDPLKTGTYTTWNGACVTCGKKEHKTTWTTGLAHKNRIMTRCKGPKIKNMAQSRPIEGDIHEALHGLEREPGTHEQNVHTMLNNGENKTIPMNNEDQKENMEIEVQCIHPIFKKERKDKKKTEKEGNNDPPRKLAPICMDKVDDLTVISWNCDRSARAITPMLIHARREKADVVNIQEGQMIHASQEWFLDQGYRLIRHGKVAMLLNTETVEKLRMEKPWKGRDENDQAIDAMSITVRTRWGSLQIMNAYLPSGLDRQTKEAVDRAVEMHLTITKQAGKTKAAVICMDANETTTSRGRMQIKGKSREYPNETRGGLLEGTSTMACYMETTVDAHRHANAHMYTEDQEPSEECYTHTQPTLNGGTSYAVLDRTLVTKNIAHRIISCGLDDRTKQWKNTNISKSYHKLMKLHLDWKDLWTCTQTETQTDRPLMGSILPNGINTKALHEDNKGILSRRVDEWLGRPEIQKRINRASRVEGDVNMRINELTDILMSPCDKWAARTLGRITIRNKEGRKCRIRTAMRKWKTLKDRVKVLLREKEESMDVEVHETLTSPPPRARTICADSQVVERIKWMHEKHGIILPSEDHHWKKWLETNDYHRASYAEIINPRTMTETESMKNRAAFYKDIMKIGQSTTVTSLTVNGKIISDPWSLEKATLDKVHTLADCDEHSEAPLRLALQSLERMYTTAKDVLTKAMKNHQIQDHRDKAIKAHKPLQELTRWFKDNLSIQTPNTCREWTHWLQDEKQTVEENLRRRLGPENDGNDKQEEERKVEEGLDDDTLMMDPTMAEIKEAVTDLNGQSQAGALPPAILKVVALQEWEIPDPTEPSDKDTKNTIRKKPREVLSLLRKIVTMAIKIKNLPSNEKITVTTNIPKMEGQVNDLDKTRPISVSPIIGRIINKIMARRLARTLDEHSYIDKAQHAFLPGKSIHEPIQTAIHCYQQSLTTPNNKPGRAMYAVYYDLSKAYDTMRWSSIEKALRRIGAGRGFIDFVMNSLEGTMTVMKTGSHGRVTPMVQMRKAVKQGCPLAPLLFAIVMDELHVKLRKSGLGYKIKHGPTVSSRGYCDDTMIIADKLGDIETMNTIVQNFCKEHHFTMNIKDKSYITGRNADGTEISPTYQLKWGKENITKIATTRAIRYLGAYVAADLNWKKQISVMNASVMHVVASLRHKKITLLQGMMITKEVLGPKLEIGLRHAYIPITTLECWDVWIMGALRSRVDLGCARIHKSAISTIMKGMTIVDKNAINKTVQLMEGLTKPSEMRDHYGYILEKTMVSIHGNKGKRGNKMEERANRLLNKQETLEWGMKHRIKPSDTNSCKVIKTIAKQGYCILKNCQFRQNEKPITKHKQRTQMELERMAFFNNAEIPYRQTYDLWGEDFARETEEGEEDDGRVIACTDGSTYPDLEHSGAGIAYLCDDYASLELFLPSHHWKIHANDNFAAEMAAINKCIRSIPVTVPITIYTDSKSCIQAIKKMRKMPKHGAPLNSPARTYLNAICKAMDIRDKHGAQTQILHIRSHTGNRDGPSLGNEQADRAAKEAATCAKLDVGDICHMEYELSHVLYIREVDENDEDNKWKPTHNNIRKAMNKMASLKHVLEWARPDKRPRAGEIMKKAGKKVLALVDEVWKEPTSLKLKFLMQVLNQADMEWPRPICDRCMTGTRETVRHIFECTSNADIYNQALLDIGTVLGTVDQDDKHEMEDHVDRDTAHGETYNSITKLAHEMRKILRGGQTPSSTMNTTDITEAKLVRMMDHTRRGYKSYVPVTKWTKPQEEPRQEKQTGKDGTWEHIPLITSIPDVDKAEGPNDSTDKNDTQIPRINEDIALVAAHEHDRNGEHMWIARVKKINKKSFRVEWYEKDPDKDESGSWWSLQGQCSTVYNYRTILGRVKWGERRNLRSTSMLTVDRNFMPTQEYEALMRNFEGACRHRTWEQNTKKGKAPGRPRKSARREMWNAHRKDFGVEDKYDKERWKKKDTTIRGNNTGWDILDGYLYREGFPFASVQIITEPQTGKTTGLKMAKDTLQGDRITPMGGKLFRIHEHDIQGYAQEEYRMISTLDRERGILVPHKTVRENMGLGFFCRTTHIKAEANAKEDVHNNGIRIIATEDINTGEEVIVYQAKQHMTLPLTIAQGGKRGEAPKKKQKYISTYLTKGKQDLAVTHNKIREEREKETLDTQTSAQPNRMRKRTLSKKRKLPDVQTVAQDLEDTERKAHTPTALINFTGKDTRNAKASTTKEWMDIGWLGKMKNPIRSLGIRGNRGKDSWVTSEVIITLGELIREHAEEHMGKRTWILDPHYVTQALHGNLNKDTLKRAFLRLKRDRRDLYADEIQYMDDLDQILIPFCVDKVHWVLGTIDFRNTVDGAKIEITHSLQNLDKQKETEYRDRLAHCILDQILSVQETLSSPKIPKEAQTNWKTNRDAPQTCPQQTNISDCGVYLCGAMACAIYDMLPSDSQVGKHRQVDTYRLRMAHDIISKRIHFTMRANDMTDDRVKIRKRNGKIHKRNAPGKRKLNDKEAQRPTQQTGDIGKDMIVIALAPPWPFAAAKIIKRLNGDKIRVQWYTSISPGQMDENNTGEGTHFDDPFETYEPCWTFRGTAYTNATPHFPAHGPYTNFHSNMTLTEEDIMVKDFDLTDKGNLPLDIIKKCVDHPKINWPRKKEEKETRTKLDNINANKEEEHDVFRKPDEQDKKKNVLDCTKIAAQMLDKTLIENTINTARLNKNNEAGFRTSKELITIIRNFLHTTGEAFTNALHVDENDRWHSLDETDMAMGAEGGTRTSFILGTSTWINLIDNRTNRLAFFQEVLDIFRENKPDRATRVAMLMYATDVPDYVRDPDRTDLTTIAETYVLLDIRENIISLRNSDPEGLKYNNTHRNTETLSIVIIENNKAPKIDTDTMKKELKKANIELESEDIKVPLYKRLNKAEKAYTTHAKEKIHMWPALMWFRKSPGLLRVERQDKGPTVNTYVTAHGAMWDHDVIIGKLGIPPMRLKTHLINLGVPETSVTTDKLKIISKIIFNATLEAYRRYETWKRRKKYGLD